MGARQTASVIGDCHRIGFAHGVVDALLIAMELREPASAGHAHRVADLAMHIGRDILGREIDLVTLRIAALLHDVGKIALSDCIVRKAGPLNEEERTLMRLHPELGYKIAWPVPALAGAAEAILAHQEYSDGKGYPRGLHGNDIPLDARIIAVADAFDVITHDRPYKQTEYRARRCTRNHAVRRDSVRPRCG